MLKLSKIIEYLNHPQSKCIYQTKENIQVFEKKPYRWVIFNKNYIQSIINLNNPTKLLLPYLKTILIFLKEKPRKVLLLGLGGGGLIHALDAKTNDYSITAVEKFESMIEISKNFFFIRDDLNLKIIHQSAEDYMLSNNCLYNYIVIDLGDKDGFPQSCFNEDFFINCYKSLQANGHLLLNLPNYYEISQFKPFIINTFGASPMVIESQGNWILIAKKTPESKAELLLFLKEQSLIKSYQWDNLVGEHVILHSPLSKFIHFFKKVFI